MASPVVAGIAAEILSRYPELEFCASSHMEQATLLKEILMKSVDANSEWGDLVKSGGRLNLEKAMTFTEYYLQLCLS